MTMPHLMNCSHDGDGWCLQCQRNTLLVALKAQQDYSDMCREIRTDGLPQPNDPRYTPVIGEWNGLHAPELRFHDFAYARRDIRKQAIEAAERNGAA